MVSGNQRVICEYSFCGVGTDHSGKKERTDVSYAATIKVSAGRKDENEKSQNKVIGDSMKKIFGMLLVCLICSTTPGLAKNKYRVSDLPGGFVQDARVVVRERSIRFEVRSDRKATSTVTEAYTIYNREQQRYGRMSVEYDKFHSIEDFDGALYDASGEKIRDLKNSDIKDYAEFGDDALYEDTRIREAELLYNVYPYTVEFTREMSFDGFLNWPKWFAQETCDPVEHTKFEVVVPLDSTLRFWCNNDSVKPVITIEDDKKVYTWEARFLPKLDEDGFDNIEDVTSIVVIAPAKFQIGSYRGTMTSWKEFGKWCYGLWNEKDRLPESAVQEIKKIVKPEDDTVTKIKKLYQYMQSRTRYVSVQLGIGGWQPFDAAYVHNKGYGDCKALVNYLAALLKSAGIASYPVLIHSGSNSFPMLLDFPNNQFNHVILSVPLPADTIWLECTSQTMPFHTLGSFTYNRDALMLTPDGGVVVHTPSSTADDNEQIRKADIQLNFDVSTADIKTRYTGMQRDYVRDELYHESLTEVDCSIIGNSERLH
jgi:hypothetical protein